MSNHTWTCTHGIEFGQGCSEGCPECEDRWKREDYWRARRRELTIDCFINWHNSGKEADLFAGVAKMAKGATALKEQEGKE